MIMISPAKQYDPRMHSAEHILNQTMDRVFGCGRSVNAHIEKKKSRCDYRFDRSLTNDELILITDKVNEVIQQNLTVSEELINIQQAEKLYNLSKLPADAGDTIRIIKIGDYDSCPCSGLHVNNTKEIGKFILYSASYNNGMLRIRFKLNENPI